MRSSKQAHTRLQIDVQATKQASFAQQQVLFLHQHLFLLTQCFHLVCIARSACSLYVGVHSAQLRGHAGELLLQRSQRHVGAVVSPLHAWCAPVSSQLGLLS